MFLRRFVDGFMQLVADGGGLEIHRTAGVLPVFQNMHNRCLIPFTGVHLYLLSV